MAKLVDIIGKELYGQLSEEVKTKYKNADLDDVSSEKYVSKERFNQKNEEAKEYKKQVKERDTQIADLKNEYKDVDGLKEKVEQLETDNKKKDEDYQAEIEKINKNNALEKELSNYSIKDDKALNYIKSLLDNDKLKYTDGGIVGLKDQMDSIKADNDFLFTKEIKGAPNFDTGNNGDSNEPTKDTFIDRMAERESKSIEAGKEVDKFFS